MAKRKTAKKKTAKRARAAKSTTVTTMTTKTTRTTTSRNPGADRDLLRKFREDYLAAEDVIDTGDPVPWPVGTVVKTLDPSGYHDSNVVIAHPTFLEVSGHRTIGIHSGWDYHAEDEDRFVSGGSYFGPVEDQYWKADPVMVNAVRKVKQLKIPDLPASTERPKFPGPRSSRMGSYGWAHGADEDMDVLRGEDFDYNPSREENPMRLGKQDKAVIRAFTEGRASTFVEGRPGENTHLTTDGTRLDGLWLGGNGIAVWKGGKIHFSDLGSKSAQTVQNAVRKEAPKNDLFNGRGWNPQSGGFIGGGKYRIESDADEALAIVRGGKEVYEVTYLPYADAPPSITMGQHRGSPQRFYRMEIDARSIFAGLTQSGHVENATLLRVVPSKGGGYGKVTIDEWHEGEAARAYNPKKKRSERKFTDEQYRKARAEAQARADASGMDVGLEWNSLFGEFSMRTLPRRENRTGHELRVEVVHPMDLAKTHPGHGPGRGNNPSGAQPGTREWYRRNLIVDEGVVDRVMHWHGGQGTELYSFGSTAAHDYVSPSMAQRAIDALEYIKGRKSKGKLTAKDKRESDNLIGDLQAYTIFSSEHTTKKAGLGDVDSGLDERGMRDDEVSFEKNPAALLYSERTMIVVEEEETALQQNPAKGSGKTPSFTKVADRVYVGRGTVKGQDVYGKPRSWSVDFRLDGRDGDFYRVDTHTLGPWEAIDGGEQSAREQIRTLPAAKALVAKWIAAAKEQQTISPRVARASNPAPARQKNPRQASMSLRISGA